jgi:hypothetical protein
MTDEERLELLRLLTKHVNERREADDLNAETTIEELAESLANEVDDTPLFEESVLELMSACGLTT